MAWRAKLNRVAPEEVTLNMLEDASRISNASCAVSCTGQGEHFIRATVARDICALVEYSKLDARKAAETVIEHRLAQVGGKGGVIVAARDGVVACVFNTELMYRGFVTHDTPARTAIRAES